MKTSSPRRAQTFKGPDSAIKSLRLKPPKALSDFQRWFGRAASRPLRAGNATVSRGVDGASLEREANARLNTVNRLSGLARLEVYNRQYWFRLITIMQEEFPCTLHVIGLDDFNRFVIRFLDAHPPTSPYLADMDATFPAFLCRGYRRANREQVLEAAAYDKALSRALDASDAFVTSGAPAVSSRAKAEAQNAVVDPAHMRWVRAPHVTPLWLHWDFAAYRALCRADEELTGTFPLKRKGGRTGFGLQVHRHEGTLYEKPMTRAEFLLLDALATPRTLDALFARVRKNATPPEIRSMERNVSEWFKTWVELGWILTPRPPLQ
jgi:Putative DNA-binding domain